MIHSIITNGDRMKLISKQHVISYKLCHPITWMNRIEIVVTSETRGEIKREVTICLDDLVALTIQLERLLNGTINAFEFLPDGTGIYGSIYKMLENYWVEGTFQHEQGIEDIQFCITPEKMNDYYIQLHHITDSIVNENT